jgi:aspartokinase/homoserine dehydrogenase 1
VLRHVAQVERDGAATVGVVALGLDDPLANLRPGDNCVEVVSDRYRHNPLVIRGAGAGPAVTAGAVLADLIEAGGGRAPG